MVSLNARPAPLFDPVSVSFNSMAPDSSDVFGLTPIATAPASFSEDSGTKIRKPYTIKKSRENWTEQEHDKFIEALHLFDRDWKKIEAFVGSKTVVQIRSHAQKYFLKVQKSGANEHLPPPRPKKKARHPYPQKAPKSVAALPSHAIGSLPASNAPLLQPAYLYSSSDSQSLVGNPPLSTSSSASANLPKPVIQEEPGVSAAALPKNRCYSTGNKEVTPRLPAVTESNDDDESFEKPRRVMPNFAQVYRFIGSVFDPNTSGHLQRLKQMDPINIETVLLLMRNLSVNLTSPEFAEQRKLISSYSSKALK